jgi:hypothetical protein
MVICTLTSIQLPSNARQATDIICTLTSIRCHLTHDRLLTWSHVHWPQFSCHESKIHILYKKKKDKGKHFSNTFLSNFMTPYTFNCCFKVTWLVTYCGRVPSQRIKCKTWILWQRNIFQQIRSNTVRCPTLPHSTVSYSQKTSHWFWQETLNMISSYKYVCVEADAMDLSRHNRTLTTAGFQCMNLVLGTCS